uniref:Uncharacterized protein n=1 Tax=Arundo donax TaxID=35708 RepID=A0A0A9A7U9_ARUDO
MDSTLNSSSIHAHLPQMKHFYYWFEWGGTSHLGFHVELRSDSSNQNAPSDHHNPSSKHQIQPLYPLNYVLVS